MNERIKELSKQAEQYALDKANEGNDEDYDYSFDDDFQQKFAELIVQECISINRQRMFSEWEGDSHRVAHNNALLCATSDMFEHFGVEE